MNLRRKLTYRAAMHLGRRPARLGLPQAAISFCFDDFPKSAADAGARILEDRGLRGTFYACADFAGRTIQGVRQYDPPDLQRLSAVGHEIGCHTASHPRLSDLSRTQIEDEFDRNSRGLAAMGLTAPVETFAYPFGDLSPGAKRVAADRFLACRGVWAGLNAGVVDRGLLACVCLEAHVLATRPAEAWIDEAVARGAWLIFLTHDVAPDPTPYGIAPDALKALVDRAAASGADILPVVAAFRGATQTLTDSIAAAGASPPGGAV